MEKHDIPRRRLAAALDLLLPDNRLHEDERVDYRYDSAGRTISVKYSDGTTNQDLFTAAGSMPTYDAFGRITTAQYGLPPRTTASYADDRAAPAEWA